MMGSSGGGSTSEFGSAYELLRLIQDNKAYEGKLQELERRKRENERTLQQSVENIKKAEETYRVAEEMMTKAETLVKEATSVRQETDKKEAELVNRERHLSEQIDLHQAHKVKSAETHADRESTIAAAEKDLKDSKDRHVVELDKLAQDRAEFTAECVRKFASIEAERTAIVDAASAELAVAKGIRAEAEAVADRIAKKLKAHEELIAKINSL